MSDPTEEAKQRRDAALRQQARINNGIKQKLKKARHETEMGREGNNPNAKPYGSSKNTKSNQDGTQNWNYNAPYNSASINNEETTRKRKYKKPDFKNKQIMGMNATFSAKADDTKDAGMAQNPYESVVRYVIPAERQDVKFPDGTEMGYDKTVEPEDSLAQLKRRKALKIAKIYRIDEDGPFGGGTPGGGGYAGEPVPGTTNTSQAGGTNYRLTGNNNTNSNYKLISAGKKMKSLKELKETLSKKASAGEFIKDFEKSDAPQFKGKSEKKKKEMALAAYYAKQNEEVMSEGELDGGSMSGKANDALDVGAVDSAKTKLMGKVKKVQEMAVRDMAGKEYTVKKQPVRMADGTIKNLPPGKSDSSGH